MSRMPSNRLLKLFRRRGRFSSLVSRNGAQSGGSGWGLGFLRDRLAGLRRKEAIETYDQKS